MTSCSAKSFLRGRLYNMFRFGAGWRRNPGRCRRILRSGSEVSIAMRIIISFLTALPALALNNGIHILNPAGNLQTDIPYSTARMFAAGEIPSSFACAQPYIDGAPAARWQCQKVNTWGDGSLKYALFDFMIPAVPPEGVHVDFRSSAFTSGGGTAVTKAQVIAAPWGADARFIYNAGTANAVTVTRDVRDIFSGMVENEECVIGAETSTSRKLRRRRDGPVLTEWIIEDLCTGVVHDFGMQWDGSKWIEAGAPYYS